MASESTKTIPKPEIPFNHRTIEAYSKEGLEAPRARWILGRHNKFTARFKADKGPLQIIIQQMVRQRKTVFDDKGKAVTKDFLVYSYDLKGKDWLGNEMCVSGNIEGKHLEPKFTTSISINRETGQHIETKEHAGHEEVYTIELTEKNRKKVIEDIINKSTGSTTDQIRFVARFPETALGASFHCNLYSFDQFLNSSIDELERLGRKEGGPQGNAPRLKDTKPYMG